MDMLRKLTLASIGGIELTREKLEGIFDEMVKRGEMSDDQRASAVKSFMEKSAGSAEKAKQRVEEIFAKYAEKCSATITEQLSTLGKRTEELAGKIEDLEKKISSK